MLEPVRLSDIQLGLLKRMIGAVCMTLAVLKEKNKKILHQWVSISVFVYLIGVYVAFHTVQVISRQTVFVGRGI